MDNGQQYKEKQASKIKKSPSIVKQLQYSVHAFNLIKVYGKHYQTAILTRRIKTSSGYISYALCVRDGKNTARSNITAFHLQSHSSLYFSATSDLQNLGSNQILYIYLFFPGGFLPTQNLRLPLC